MSQRPVALVTGGGTGIGAAVTRRLVDDGYAVVIAGRRRDRLDAVAEELGEAVSVVQLDVTDAPSVASRASVRSNGSTSSSTTRAVPSA